MEDGNDRAQVPKERDAPEPSSRTAKTRSLSPLFDQPASETPKGDANFLIPGSAGTEPVAGASESDLTIGALWPQELTPRLRVLLHTLPLDALRRADSMRDNEFRHYDGVALALRVLDVVIDHLGLDREADHETITRALSPILMAMDKAAGVAPSPVRHDAMTEKVLAALRNDLDARRPFREEYSALDSNGEAGRFFVEFRLLFDAFHASGRTVIRPSSEACNLYLRLLDLDVEDAQAAAEAVVQSQLARGRFDEAVQSARQARIQSVRFRDKILRILRDTRRDAERVDWQHEVPQILTDGLDHLERRLAVEREILGAAHGRLEVMAEDDASGSRAVAGVAVLTRECLLRHTELHEQLISARSVFLEAQGRQSFAPGPTRPLPDLPASVLEPALGLTLREALPVAERGFSLLVGPHAPPIASIGDLVSWMLQPRRPVSARDVPIEPIDPTDLDAELQRYPEEIRTAAQTLVGLREEPIRLSQLVAQARDDGLSDAVIELLALLALQGFCHEDRTQINIASEASNGGPLNDVLLYGDDLMVRTMREGHDAIA